MQKTPIISIVIGRAGGPVQHALVARLIMARERLKEVTTLSPVLYAKGAKAMRSTGVANSEQLGVLKQVLEEYCDAQGISAEEDREQIASFILRLFDRGLSRPEEITAALKEFAAQYRPRLA